MKKLLNEGKVKLGGNRPAPQTPKPKIVFKPRYKGKHNERRNNNSL